MAEVLINATGIHKAWGTKVLFDDLDFRIHKGQKLAFLGRNGSGKSTLIRILSGEETSFDGEVQYKRGLKPRVLSQDNNLKVGQLPIEVVLGPYGEGAKALLKYHKILGDLQSPEVSADMDLMEQALIDLADAESEVDDSGLRGLYSEFCSLCGRFQVDLYKPWDDTFSGGETKRIQLVAALVGEPELLLLDEPTNHLDDASIGWVEDWLSSYHGTLVLVTHDRYFLERVVTSISELVHGNLDQYEGNFSVYLEKKQQRLEHARIDEQKRQNFLRKEVDWIRRQPKARGTKSKARIQQYEEINSRRHLTTEARLKLQFGDSFRLGKRVLEMHGLGFAYPNSEFLFRNIDRKLFRGERIGILGKNGAGKSTLIKVLLEQLKLSEGEMKWGESVQTSYFSQKREALDPTKTVWESVQGEGDYVELGEHKIHKRGFLDKMLFDTSLQNTKVERLSGGEKNRLQLVQVMLEPSNMLILDEPTNDLDIETLGSLEDYVVDFPGVVLVVSHDRYFLDKICTSLWVLDEGDLTEIPGNYSDFQNWKSGKELAARQLELEARDAKNQAKNQGTKSNSKDSKKKNESSTSKKNDNSSNSNSKVKISWQEKKDLEDMEALVLGLESSLEEIDVEMAEASKNGQVKRLQELETSRSETQDKISASYERWQFLEQKAAEA